MAYFPDLARCDYFDREPGISDVAGVRIESPGVRWSSFLRAVGWLEADYLFTVGRASSDFLHRLDELLEHPWQPAVFLGSHCCDLCAQTNSSADPEEGTPSDPPLGSFNLYVPANDRVYVAPELIRHYIHAHGYVPPTGFVDAVLGCPDMSSAEYFASIRLASTAEFSTFSGDAGHRDLLRVVRIGPGLGSFTRVDVDTVAFIDENARPGRVALEEARHLGCGYVARRKLDEAPWTVTFPGHIATRFEFENSDAAYELLLIPLQGLGLRTFDVT